MTNIRNTENTPGALSPDETVRRARHVTWVGFWINAALGVVKILAGVLGRSQALIADGVHSISDFVSDIIVIVFVGIAHKKADADHQYGHGKFETLATLILALILGAVAVAFFIDGSGNTWRAFHGQELPRPTWLALSMIIVSIVSKEWLYRYTRREGERIGSPAVVANAWHHRSDALSSIATLVGVGGAMFLGARWRVLDPIAAMAVSVFIFGVAWSIGKPALLELLEVALPADVCRRMWSVIGSTPGVVAFHHFASRRSGSRAFVEFHIKVDPDISVSRAHAIADDVGHRLQRDFGQDLHTSIHIEPYAGESTDDNRRCTD